MTPITDSEGKQLREEEEGVEYVWCVDSAGRQRRVPAAEIVAEVPAAEAGSPAREEGPRWTPALWCAWFAAREEEEVAEVRLVGEAEEAPVPAEARRTPEALEIELDLPEEEGVPMTAQAPEGAPAEDLWPVMSTPAWQYTLAGRCAWAAGAVILAPVPWCLLSGAAAIIGGPPDLVAAIGGIGALSPWALIAWHELRAAREQPWQAVRAEKDGGPITHEEEDGRRWVLGRRGRQERWIPAEAWGWAEEEEEAGGRLSQAWGAVRSHLPRVLGGGQELAAEALEQDRRREERAEEALRLRREAQDARLAHQREVLALAQAREARMAAAQRARQHSD